MTSLNSLEQHEATRMIRPVFEEAWRRAFGGTYPLAVNRVEVKGGDWKFTSRFLIGDINKQLLRYGNGKGGLPGDYADRPHLYAREALSILSTHHRDKECDEIDVDVWTHDDGTGEYILRFNPNKVQLKKAIPILAEVMKDYEAKEAQYLAQPFKVHMDVLLTVLHQKLNAKVSYDHSQGEEGKVKLTMNLPRISGLDYTDAIWRAVPNEAGGVAKMNLRRQLTSGVIEGNNNVTNYNLFLSPPYTFDLSQRAAGALAHVDLNKLKSMISQPLTQTTPLKTQASRG